MKYVLGLTGQTGAGKSTLSGIAEKAGFFVINCDEVAHSVIEKDEVKTALTAVFTSNILNADGTVSRPQLAARAFANKESTQLLNETVLPFIVREIACLTEKTQKDKILLDAPTLYESGADKMCNSVVAVIADSSVRKKRIIERDNLTSEAADKRINAGQKEEFYLSHADKVIKNNGNLEEFQKEFESIINNIRR
jgi:dephospho-CoA kinase